MDLKIPRRMEHFSYYPSSLPSKNRSGSRESIAGMLLWMSIAKKKRINGELSGEVGYGIGVLVVVVHGLLIIPWQGHIQGACIDYY